MPNVLKVAKRILLASMFMLASLPLAAQTCSADKNGVNVSGNSLYMCYPGAGNGQLFPTSGGSSLNYVVTSNGFKCDGATDDTVASASLLQVIGSNQANLIFPSSTPCLLGNVTFPTNVTLDFSQGGSIQPITSSTAAGNAVFVQGTSVETDNTSTCVLNMTTTGTPSSPTVIVFMIDPYPGFSFNITSVTDTASHAYFLAHRSLSGQPRNEDVWVTSNITTSSAITITATANGTLTHVHCIAHEYSGLGPFVTVDGVGSDNRATGTTMSSGSSTTLSGSLLIASGGQPFTAETCTAGTGYTQPAGSAGQTTNGFLCAEYKLSSAGGSTSATQTITTDPTPGTWVYSLVALRPGSATVTVLGGVRDPNLHKIFFNSLPGQGTIDFTGNTGITTVYPEWWGAGPTPNVSDSTAPLQAAEHAAFGTNRTNGSGLNKWNKVLFLGTTYAIAGELQFYHVLGFKIACANRLAAGITQFATNSRIIDGQSMAYGAIYDCAWSSQASSTKPLIDLDFDNSQGNDLRPQFVDFYNNNFNGSNIVDTGVLISKSGGGAQGSNFDCFDCEAIGFTGAAWQIGGNNTGRNAGRFYAQNALVINWYGGDMQGNPLYGLAIYGGGYGMLDTTSMENGFSTQTGVDMYCEATQGPCIMRHVRSESRRLAQCSDCQIYDSRTIDQSTYPTPGNTLPVGTIVSGSSEPVAGDGGYYQVTVDNAGGMNGVGTPSVPEQATSGTTTSVTKSAATYTVNGFTGMLVAFTGGTNGGCYGVVTSNTATTITASAGWITRFANLLPACTAPDSTSKYVVEPNWNQGTIVDGSVTFVAMNEDGIGSCNGCGGPSLRLNDVILPGERIRLSLSFSTVMSGVHVSRVDWYDASGSNQINSGPYGIYDLDVSVTASNGFPTAGEGTIYPPWSFPAIGGAVFSGMFHRHTTAPWVWSTGQAGATPQGANDCWVGGRTDFTAGTDPTRNILEFGCMLGRSAPASPGNTLNQTGTDTDITGGPSTGSAAGGAVNFWTSNPGASGTTVNSGLKRGSIDSTGLHLNVGGSAGKAICWKADGKTLGFCSTQPDTTGSCTCN